MFSLDFEWLADDEQDWEDLAPVTEADEPSNLPGGRRGWLVGLIIVAIIAVPVFLLLNNRVDEAVEQAKEEVLVTHDLLLEAVAAQDYELFQTLLSDQNRTWFDNQAQLLSLGLFWGRSALGLEPALSSSAGRDSLEIDLDPDLKRAEIRQTTPFVTSNSAGITRTVQLERTFLYERLGGGWYLSALEDDASFWGIWERQPGDIMTLVYPGRDAEIGRKLAPLLDDLVVDLCADPAVGCPGGLQLELKLDRDVQALLRISEGFSMVNILVRDGKGTLGLPAPTLVGRPVDDAGYQALTQGYASWLGAVLINNFAVLDAGADLSIITDLLSARDYTLPPLPQPMMPHPSSVEHPVGVFAPQQDILMLCTGGNQQRLLRFQTADSRWSNEWIFKTIRKPDEAANFPVPSITRLPDYSGVLVTFAVEEGEQMRWVTTLWRNGQEKQLLQHDEPAYFWSPQTVFIGDEDGNLLPGYYLSVENNSSVVDSWWIDWQKCAQGACDQRGTDGTPLWSPDGKHTLLTVMAPYEQPQLHLGDSQGRSLVYLGSGLPVAWVDEETFVYLRRQVPVVTDPTRHGIWQELVVGKIGPEGDDLEEPQLLFEAQELKKVVTLNRVAYQMGIVTALPYEDGWLLAARELGKEFQAGSFIFFFQPETGVLTSMMENEMEMILPPLIMDIGGPYLAVFALRDNGPLLRLLDPETKQVLYKTNHFPVDWSSDRQWLLFVEGRQLRVAAPALDYEWTIEHNLPDCYSAVWVNRES